MECPLRIRLEMGVPVGRPEVVELPSSLRGATTYTRLMVRVNRSTVVVTTVVPAPAVS